MAKALPVTSPLLFSKWWVSQKLGVPFLGVPIVKVVVFWGL